MRLLNKTTFDFESFPDDQAPAYLILSHRWHGEETTLQDFTTQHKLPESQWSAGTAKIIRFCEQAKAEPQTHVWCDTACIDKSSSAELQEAINSMYKWYERASSCWVYLDDVTMTPDDTEGKLSKVTTQQLRSSQWWRRGWTLQELLAPLYEVFYDSNWRPLGTRSELKSLIQEITGISSRCFGNWAAIKTTPVAKRMSWLSERRTYRPEDLAYCMLGIFGINMTMLYGEGHRAFQRLQKEIIREIHDESIFLWRDASLGRAGARTAVLAEHPQSFAWCKGVDVQIQMVYEREPCQMTSRGLQIETYGTRDALFGRELSVLLNCKVGKKPAAFRIQRTFESPSSPNDWYRIQQPGFETAKTDPKPSQVPSAWNDYRAEYAEIRGHKLPKKRSSSSLSAPKDKTEFDSSIVKFKVYIRNDHRL